ncbi:MAG TPA: four helix bundle protein [Anaerolineae bacterium]|nr:four helix bundle protein [Anaerolineae bacterium]
MATICYQPSAISHFIPMPFRFESLDIWHAARAFANAVYRITAKFPRHEDYGLHSQMNRAANSICLNIAEGSARSTDKAFDNYLEISIGSVFEVASASYRAMDENYITAEEHKALYNQAEILAKRINAFRGKLHP